MGKRRKKTMKFGKDLPSWTSIILLVLSGINVLLRIFGASFPILDYVLVGGGFIGILVIVYAMNEMKFKSLLDLVLFAIIIAVLGYAAALGLPAAIQNAPLIYQIFQGFAPLMTGLTVGGIITIIFGLVRLKKIKK